MRHISHLSEVQLCVRHRPFDPPFKYIRWPGSRKARIALDRAVGRMHLDDWKHQNVGNPLPYFRIALAEITRNGSIVAGQNVVETVLSTSFPQGFSKTLQTLPFKPTGRRAISIHDELRKALLTALGSPDVITPGFEDMLPKSSGGPVVKGSSGPGPGPGGGGPEERYALEEAIGAAVIDYFNGYSVESIKEAFEGCGGTDLHIRNALEQTFEKTFGTDFDETLRRVDTGTANVAMRALANEFSKQLNASIKNNPSVQLYAVFSDLESLKYP